MSELFIETARDDDAQAAYWAIAFEAFGVPPAKDLPGLLDRYRQQHTWIARAGGAVAGGLVVTPLGQWFGGRSVPMAGIHAVAVAPEHRGGGVAVRLMRAVLEAERARGVAISTLFPATQPLYRSVGYELAGSYVRYRVPVPPAAPAEPTLEVERVGVEALAHLREVYTGRAAREAGNLDRSEWIWRRLLEPVGESVTTFRVGAGGATEGYVVLSQQRPPGGGLGFELVVRDLVALTPAAGRRLLRLVAEHRSMAGHFTLYGPPAPELLWWLPEQEHAVDQTMRWMIRILDVRAALEARGYPPGLGAEVELELSDDLLPGNAGRWRLEIAGGRAQVRDGGAGRPVRADIRALASLYSGYATAAQLAAVGLLSGHPDDLARLSAIFAGPPPWMAEMF
jgi:predicted acetyltransferase